MCKIYLTPKAAKRKKEEIKEDKKLKKEESVLKEEVEQLDLHQPDQSQLQPQYRLLPAQEEPLSQPQPFHELISFEDLSDDFEDFLTEFTNSHGDDNSGFEGFVTD